MHRFTLQPPRPQALLDKAPFYQRFYSDGRVCSQYFRTDAGYLLRFPDLADFQVFLSDPAVVCSPVPDVAQNWPNHVYLNVVIPLVRSVQGNIALHGSAVEIAGGAVAFVGWSQRGKSTLAAAFALDGFRFLTDDALVLEAAGEDYQVLPSHPSIRLWHDSEEALIPPGTQTAPALQDTSKSRFLAGTGIPYCDRPKPLRRVYFLGDGSETGVTFERVGAAEALALSVQHSFLLDVESKSLVASHFEKIAKFADRPMFYRLDYPRRFQDLARVRQAVVEHAATEGEDAWT
jgi:hypothetical protein